ncbi:hypothetical protein AVEN_12274-1 [Araneus ventricosus]|uniref:Transposase Tc1-like domain-containing protein n=1 Tax=Araneus ventricosus TaxID=182803 RepID=A0A4Y2U0B3_ARAVE|nr:hypothetical protein AVEN_12274-1 [Araneus ventricosus]
MARRLGTSVNETARLVGCSRSAVVSIHAKWINDGDMSSRRQGVGVHESPKKKDVRDCPACRRPTRVPLLTKRHRQLRLQWAREHRDWTMDEWKRVAWSDEFRFLIHHVDGHVRVRHLPCEQLLPLVQQVIHRLVVAVLCFGRHSHGRL